ncbi:hypothetical protein TrST_g6944 [Triparma strigata]|uniref:RING-type domain-containing protein n=1 Tax=Triparma strigata TaxID=1606541 RepID=A0A9W7BTA4_9STRA|nr:hypothetical protein TrST_g6944 [Triparma strigata]
MMNEDKDGVDATVVDTESGARSSPQGSPQSKKPAAETALPDPTLIGNIEVQRATDPFVKQVNGKVEVAVPGVDDDVEEGWDRAPLPSENVVIGVSDTNLLPKNSSVSTASGNKAVNIEITESLSQFAIDDSSSSGSLSTSSVEGDGQDVSDASPTKKSKAAKVLEQVNRIVQERGKVRVESLDLDLDDDATKGLCPLCCELLLYEEIINASCVSCEFNICSVCLSNLFMSNRGTCPGCRDDSFFVNVPSVNKARTKAIIDNHDDSELTASQLREKYSGWDVIPVSDSSMSELHDPTLLQDMEGACTKTEKEYLTRLLTGGNVEEVVKASAILNGIESMVRSGEVTDEFRVEQRYALFNSPPPTSKTPNLNVGRSTGSGSQNKTPPNFLSGFKRFGDKFKKKPPQKDDIDVLEEKAKTFKEKNTPPRPTGSSPDDGADGTMQFSQIGPLRAPPAVPFSCLSLPPLPSRMPSRVTLDPSELKLFNRLGRKDSDVGIKFGKSDLGVIMVKTTGQAFGKGLKVGDVLTCFDDVRVDNDLIGLDGIIILYEEKIRRKAVFSVTVNCDQKVCDELRERAEVVKLLQEL